MELEGEGRPPILMYMGNGVLSAQVGTWPGGTGCPAGWPGGTPGRPAPTPDEPAATGFLARANRAQISSAPAAVRYHARSLPAGPAQAGSHAGANRRIPVAPRQQPGGTPRICRPVRHTARQHRESHRLARRGVRQTGLLDTLLSWTSHNGWIST